MKSLTLLFLLLVSFNLFSQESDNPYKDLGKTLYVPNGYDSEEKRKERENRKLVEELKPKDLSNQFAPEIDEYLINRVKDAGNEDLIALAIRDEYAANAKNIFNTYASGLIIPIISLGLFLVYFLRHKSGRTVLMVNITWVLLCYISALLMGNTFDDMLFVLQSNISNALIYCIPYVIINLSFYFLLIGIHKITKAQRAVILFGFVAVFLFGLGYITGGYSNDYFSDFQGHELNIFGTILAVILFAFVQFSKEKKAI